MLHGERSRSGDLVCCEHDHGFVLQRFREGESAFIDAANEGAAWFE